MAHWIPDLSISIYDARAGGMPYVHSKPLQSRIEIADDDDDHVPAFCSPYSIHPAPNSPFDPYALLRRADDGNSRWLSNTILSLIKLTAATSSMHIYISCSWLMNQEKTPIEIPSTIVPLPLPSHRNYKTVLFSQSFHSKREYAGLNRTSLDWFIQLQFRRFEGLFFIFFLLCTLYSADI